MNRLITGLIVTITMFFCSPDINAQGNEATIIGKVSEVNAGSIPGATVLVRNESTGFQAGTVTDINGDYIIKQLPLGSPYSITVSFIGFGEQKKTGYSLNQGDQLRLNFAMESSATELQAVDIKANSL